jgi:hypothetical protein
MPLEIWLPGCRAQDTLTSEMKSMEASEASVAVHAAGSGDVRELAQAIALLLEQFKGLSVHVREERNGHRDFQTVRGEVPGWESIRAPVPQGRSSFAGRSRRREGSSSLLSATN